jgi:hypothetical protein
MSLCASIDANGYVLTNTTPVNECTGVVLVSPAEFNMNYEAGAHTIADYTLVFTGTFTIIFTLAFAGFKIRTATNLVKMI